MKIDLSDAMIVLGLLIAGYGFWLVSPALALIFVGLAFLVAGVSRARQEQQQRMR
jgi:hypothetical protein